MKNLLSTVAMGICLCVVLFSILMCDGGKHSSTPKPRKLEKVIPPEKQEAAAKFIIDFCRANNNKGWGNEISVMNEAKETAIEIYGEYPK